MKIVIQLGLLKREINLMDIQIEHSFDGQPKKESVFDFISGIYSKLSALEKKFSSSKANTK